MCCFTYIHTYIIRTYVTCFRFEKLVSTLELETVKAVWDKMCYNKQVRLSTLCTYVCNMERNDC